MPDRAARGQCRAKARLPERTSPIRRSPRPIAAVVVAKKRWSETAPRQKTSSRKFLSDAGGMEGRHLAHDLDRRFHETHEDAGAGSFSEAHLQIEHRRKPQLFEHQAMSLLRGEMRSKENVS